MARTRALIAVLALSAVACARGSAAPSGCEPGGVLREGDALPDCRFDLIDGSGTLALADLEGQATVLNFWASWCGPCLKEMPAFDRFDQAHPEIRVLGVNPLINGESAEAGAHFFEERAVSYDSIVDPDGSLYAHFGNPGRPIMPLTVIVDAHGTVSARHFGELDEEGLSEKVSAALR